MRPVLSFLFFVNFWLALSGADRGGRFFLRLSPTASKGLANAPIYANSTHLLLFPPSPRTLFVGSFNHNTDSGIVTVPPSSTQILYADKSTKYEPLLSALVSDAGGVPWQGPYTHKDRWIVAAGNSTDPLERLGLHLWYGGMNMTTWWACSEGRGELWFVDSFGPNERPCKEKGVETQVIIEWL